MGADSARRRPHVAPAAPRVVAAVLLAALVVPPAAHPAAAACGEARQARLDFTLRSLTGEDVALAAFAGQVILLDFWATWCAPCKVEIPWFIDFQKRYGGRGLQVLGVAVEESPDALAPYVERMGMTYPVLLGDGRDDLIDAYQPMPGLPTTFIIDREGHICLQHTGLGDR
jgi:cytochrome c biogenesis protein CcmG/thiol:disulfide interchange protein DsbE